MRRRQSVLSAYVRTISTADLAYSRCTSRRSVTAFAMSAAETSALVRVAATVRSVRTRTAPAVSSSLTISVTRAAARPVAVASSLRDTGPSARITSRTPASCGTVGPPPEAKNFGSARSLGR